jgi:phenol hydroxylase P5 protein
LAAARHKARLDRIIALSPSVRAFHLTVTSGRRFDYEAGQWASFEIPVPGEPVPLVRAYSIACAPSDGSRIELCLNLAKGGQASHWFFGLKGGEEIDLFGPKGSFTLRRPVDAPVLFVAAGTGIAPIRAMLQSLVAEKAGVPITLLFGARDEGEILYRDELEALAVKQPGFRFIPALSRPGPGWSGKRGYVQEHLAEVAGRDLSTTTYVCGLKVMVADVKAKLSTMGFTADKVRYERYD